MVTREKVYKVIDTEREYQNETWPEGDNQTIGDFILLIEEYASQARNYWSKEHPPEINALNSIRKIAGIAVRCMECHGAIPRS